MCLEEFGKRCVLTQRRAPAEASSQGARQASLPHQAAGAALAAKVQAPRGGVGGLAQLLPHLGPGREVEWLCAFLLQQQEEEEEEEERRGADGRNQLGTSSRC